MQIESTMLLVLPVLIAETGLLSFISRYYLEPARPGAPLREVPLRETTMQRRLVVAHRKGSYLSPVTQRLIALLASTGNRGLRTAGPGSSS